MDASILKTALSPWFNPAGKATFNTLTSPSTLITGSMGVQSLGVIP